MKMDLSSPFWILRKAIAAIAFSGGLRGHETAQLTFGDLEESEKGIYVHFPRAKQQGEKEVSTVLVPNKSDKSICLATKVRNYISSVESVLGPFKPEDRLLKGCKNGKCFVRQPMGKNLLSGVGKDVAKLLDLPEPNSYTGHCWRRSAATQAALNGATIAELKKGFGWHSDNVPLKYVDQTNRHVSKLAELITGSESKNNQIGENDNPIQIRKK